ncbi:MAG TPA: FtsX-like permease family protein [candidate division Zixibacteria bacterium]|nr:FtsX-like permease family protein [candidate division Zixibacteria bacterium]HER00284.1 FtsX-like permease family protein [candidate division Zixibacteria bacterium]
MQFLESFRVAANSLRTHKVRSFLTMLGIIIGVASVITVFAMGRGAERATKEQIQKYGTNVLTLYPEYGRSHSARASGQRVRLYNEDVEPLQEIPGIVAAVPQMYNFTQVKFGNEVMYARILGTTPEYEWVNNSPLVRGKYFSRTDNASRRRVAIIGTEIRKQLFGEDTLSVVGSEIKIRGISFEVIGELKEKGPGWSSPDEMVVIPLLTAQKRVFGYNYLNAITVKVSSLDLMDPVSLAIERALRRQHGLTGNDENDFRIFSQVDIIQTYQSTTDTFNWLLGSIAGVSLLVGGIGIMNIMLVSVTERTREIGLRMAVGARKRDIRLQFLIEAFALSIFGGALGIFLGSGASKILSTYFNWNTLIAPDSIMLAFGFAAFVGIVFGFYPALKASKLDPIESLRYE